MDSPILIGGTGRCGTALIMFMLEKCPAFHILNEPKRMFSVSEYEQILEKSGKDRLVIKEPHFIRVVQQLKVMLPELKIIHIIRDPRDIFASVRTRKWGPRTADEFVVWYNNIMDDAWMGREALLSKEDYLVIWLEELVEEFKTRPLLVELLKFTNPHKNDWREGRRLIIEWEKLIDYKAAHIGRWLRKDDGLTVAEAKTVFKGTQEMFKKWVNIRSKS